MQKILRLTGVHNFSKNKALHKIHVITVNLGTTLLKIHRILLVLRLIGLTCWYRIHFETLSFSLNRSIREHFSTEMLIAQIRSFCWCESLTTNALNPLLHNILPMQWKPGTSHNIRFTLFSLGCVAVSNSCRRAA